MLDLTIVVQSVMGEFYVFLAQVDNFKSVEK